MKKILIAILISASILALSGSVFAGITKTSNLNPIDLETKLKQQGAIIDHHEETGKVSFIGTAPKSSIKVPSVSSLTATKAAANSIVQNYGSLFGLADPNKELQIIKKSKTPDGRSSTRFQQVHNNVPVIAGELTLNLDKDSNLLSLSGEVSPEPLSLSTTPQLSSSKALELAVAAVAGSYKVNAAGLKGTLPELVIYDPRLIGETSSPPALVWKIIVSDKNSTAIREFILVDAISGHIDLRFSTMEQVRNRLTYDAGGTTFLPGALVATEGPYFGPDQDVAAAHNYARDTYDYYKQNYNRDSFDGKDADLISTVHFLFLLRPNARWNGSQVMFSDKFATDDVVGHEWTHAVTQYTSKLIYKNESGAINESLSDIFGEFIDQTNSRGNDSPVVAWLIGEDLPGGAIRDMADPPNYKQPDKMTSNLYTYVSTDSVVAHTNSGVNNKAAYLMANGGTFNGVTVTGIGIPKTAQIYYEAQTHLLQKGSNYRDLYYALIQASSNLVGGTSGITLNDVQQVTNAVNAVEMDVRQKYEDSTAWYEGPWIEMPLPFLASGGKLKLTMFSNSAAFFEFSGNAVDVIAAKAPGLGTFDVYVDNIFKTQVNLDNSSLQFQQIVAWVRDLSPGNHILKIVSPSNSIIDIDAFRVYNGTAKIVTHHTDAEANFTLLWLDFNLPFFTDGKSKISALAGDKATFTFTGNKVRIYGLKGPNFGIAEVRIDGNLYSTIDLYKSNLFVETIDIISNLASGNHTIEIINTGSKNSQSTGNLINIDGFDTW